MNDKPQFADPATQECFERHLELETLYDVACKVSGSGAIIYNLQLPELPQD